MGIQHAENQIGDVRQQNSIDRRQDMEGVNRNMLERSNRLESNISKQPRLVRPTIDLDNFLNEHDVAEEEDQDDEEEEDQNFEGAVESVASSIQA